MDDLRVAKPQSTRRGIVRSIDSHLWPYFLQVVVVGGGIY